MSKPISKRTIAALKRAWDSLDITQPEPDTSAVEGILNRIFRRADGGVSANLQLEFGVTSWRGRWEVDWLMDADSRPTHAEVRALVPAGARLVGGMSGAETMEEDYQEDLEKLAQEKRKDTNPLWWVKPTSRKDN